MGSGETGKLVNFHSLDPKIQDLIRRSVEVRERAYCPYSNFSVGSALLCDDGSIFTGCNVECCAPAPICAERTAIVKAVSEGKHKFSTIAVVAELRDEFVAPCGNCRQFIAEFNNKTVVYLAQPNLKNVLVTSLQELLPLSFSLHNKE